jgi:hypothetical protein
MFYETLFPEDFLLESVIGVTVNFLSLDGPLGGLLGASGQPIERCYSEASLVGGP